jgi:hypothetical protein
MKSVILAGVVMAVTGGGANSAQTTDCQFEETRRQPRERSVTAPAPSVAPTTPRPGVGSNRAVAENRSDPPRRRTGKTIPDAELMGPRLAL